ncbi:hypothetical protein WAJ43_23045, partial [Acinetobacter baumannii]
VATKTFASKNKRLIDNLLECINMTTSEFKHIPIIDRTLATKFNLQIEDIKEWLMMTKWSQNNFQTKALTKFKLN